MAVCVHVIRFSFFVFQLKNERSFGFRVTINFYEEQCLPVIKQNKKHSSKQVLVITYTLEKRVFATATFKGFWVVSFQTE